MTIKFIFDLDLTLYADNEYNDTTDENEYYNSFKRKPFLKEILNSIPHHKYILTNASKEHAIDVLKKMGIFKCFKMIMSSDMFELYKPAIATYKVAITLFKIKDTDKIYYFEDLAENLKPAKENYGWTTIWLTKEAMTHKRKPKYVDYKFVSVEEAMLYLCANNPEITKEEELSKTTTTDTNVINDNKTS
jgi:HAD superfamily hydrolase (TIGR01509 family)